MPPTSSNCSATGGRVRSSEFEVSSLVLLRWVSRVASEEGEQTTGNARRIFPMKHVCCTVEHERLGVRQATVRDDSSHATRARNAISVSQRQLP